MGTVRIRVGGNTVVLLNLFLMVSVFLNLVLIYHALGSGPAKAGALPAYLEPESGWGRGVPMQWNLLSSSSYLPQSACHPEDPCHADIELHKRVADFYASRTLVTPDVRRVAVGLLYDNFTDQAVCDLVQDDRPGSSMRSTYCKEAVSLYYGVRDSIRYVTAPLEAGDAGAVCQDSLETVKLGAGKCDEQAVLLVSLLRSVGIDASVVMLDTSRSFIDCVQSNCTLSSADHAMVLVRLDGLGQVGGFIDYWFLNNDPDTILLDPTCKTCRFGELPALDKGRMVWIV